MDCFVQIKSEQKEEVVVIRKICKYVYKYFIELSTMYVIFNKIYIESLSHQVKTKGSVSFFVTKEGVSPTYHNST